MLLSAELSYKRVKIEIQGIVQGVGFRPFIYQLAHKYNLSGYILNNGSGVVIEIEGEKEKTKFFLKELTNSNPVLSRIDSLEVEHIKLQHSTLFEIQNSKTTKINTMLSADISLCKECLKEFNNPKDRRYRHPFINCTNCGPRYTIIDNLPYDREKTSMKKFPMCSSCKEEYENPNNRRYHAQPISCYKCGPTLKYISLLGDEEKNSNKAVKKIAQLIKEGKIVGIKGLGGFHIVCDSTNDRAINELRETKHRKSKPLALMFENITSIKKVANLSIMDEEIILSKERPIVVVKKKESSFLSDLVAPNIDRIGVFLPYTPLHKLILKELDFPIVATSANLSGEPIILQEQEIFSKMPLVTQNLLTHNRDILNACDDSVVLNTLYDKITIRMARGYAPYSFFLQEKTPQKILALGANQKVTLTLVFENSIVVSPHIGDLNSIDSNEYFLRTLQTLKRVYKFEPDVIVCDKHPKYETSRFAREYIEKNNSIELIEIQHHYAHALSCMAEYALDEKVLAFCFDGTGYGDDGTLWGGEVFVADTKSYKRIYNFKQMALLGGEVAIKEPKRVALSLLFACFNLEEILMMDTKLINSFNPQEIETLYKMYKRGINTPKSSSLGRVFDGVYALSGFVEPLGYEGESGLILESLSAQSKTKLSYKYKLQDGVIDYTEMVCEIVKENSKSKIAKKFINTITKIILEIVNINSHLPVILSGGVFQNRVLVSQVTKELKKLNRKYYIQSKIPINDGGISLGQAYFAIKNSEG